MLVFKTLLPNSRNGQRYVVDRSRLSIIYTGYYNAQTDKLICWKQEFYKYFVRIILLNYFSKVSIQY